MHELWALWVGKPDFLYCDMDEETFSSKFFGPQCLTLLHESGLAFSSGTYVPGNEYGYLTAVVTDPEATGKGYGSEMLSALESEMQSRFGIKQMRIIFFNPSTLSWEVPGNPGCLHPNSPGLDVDGPAYHFFTERGYCGFARQNSYFLKLSDYAPPDQIDTMKERLRQEGISIEVYDPDTMTGMAPMLEELGNPVWVKDILGEKSIKEGGRPILVPVKDGKVLGFTGPLDREKSGRGYFAGIAVSPEARGKGVAKVLFSSLCSGLGDLGAGYMTLFTGETNPARRIYEAAGFRIVRTWDDMKKEL
ncbi:MAG: GNAT family N-acetyltransferase [Lachnospiraceae bacterium]|nr:GNAT family N-acetyltransferase [Lachnospiraceae bacterium]